MKWNATYSWTLLFIFFLVVIVGGIIVIGNASVEMETDEESSLPDIVATDPVIGAEDPSVVIVLYSEFACESCAELWDTVKAVLETYPDELAVVWKDFPNESLRPTSVPAALAARCAQDQEAFWEFADLAFTSYDNLSPETMGSMAETLELNTSKFDSCVKKEKHLDLIAKNFGEGVNLELVGSPTLYINGTRYAGMMSEAYLSSLIEEALAE